MYAFKHYPPGNKCASHLLKAMTLTEIRLIFPNVLTVFVGGGGFHQVEGVLSETKNQLSSEILWRVDLENQMQTLKEQLELQKNITELVSKTPAAKQASNIKFHQLMSFLI